MEDFTRALAQAASHEDFASPEGFLYSGGNPGQVRNCLIEELESGDQKRIAVALDFFLIALSINLFGTKLSKEGGAHRKFSSQGSGTKTLVGVVAIMVEVNKRNMPPGASLNSLAAAFPELGLLTMLSDSAKPAPAVAQMNFRREIKLGLMAKTTGIMGSGPKEAEEAAKRGILASKIGSASKPLFGGSTFLKVIDPLSTAMEEA
ncbi:hypothetical protein AK812_SmicGene2156 [Symbiodinium microadriaticum]|uniref:Uncharacterized protein n=1 Tax=Symbiodinium microadriaticum TaxID=2951 RepID=A0A1Q9F2A5_SYMMI|nr:hypothetical protein AK812_SmicGene2156 [Symbiodinium microadriaticum]